MNTDCVSYQIHHYHNSMRALREILIKYKPLDSHLSTEDQGISFDFSNTQTDLMAVLSTLKGL